MDVYRSTHTQSADRQAVIARPPGTPGACSGRFVCGDENFDLKLLSDDAVVIEPAFPDLMP